MAHKKIELDREPHVYEAGEFVFKFPADITSEQILVPYQELLDATGGDPEGFDPKDPKNFERTVEVNKAVLKVVRLMLLEESREVFDSAPLPDWVIGDMFRWIMEVYGSRRPTGPSNGSSTSPSGNGAGSTGSSRSKARRTRTPGVSRGSSTL